MDNICPHCGSHLPEGCSFCLKCFTGVAYEPLQKAETAVKSPDATNTQQAEKSAKHKTTAFKPDIRIIGTTAVVCLVAIIGVISIRTVRGSAGRTPDVISGELTVIHTAAVTATDGSAVTLENGELVTETVIETIINSQTAQAEKPGLIARIFGHEEAQSVTASAENEGNTAQTQSTTGNHNLWNGVFGDSTTSGSTDSTHAETHEAVQATSPVTNAPATVPTAPQTNAPVQPAASAEGNFSFTSDGETAVITGYTGNESNVAVPCTLGGLYVSRVETGSFSDNPNIKTITFLNAPDENSCMFSVAESAFCNLPALTKIVFPYEISEFNRSIVNCPSLSETAVNGASSSNYKRMYCADGVLFDTPYGNLTIAYYPQGKQDTEYTVPSSRWTPYAICNNPYIKKITFGAKSLYSEIGDNFHGCTALTEFAVSPQTSGFFVVDGVLYSNGSKLNNQVVTELYLYPPAKTGTLFTFSKSIVGNYSGMRDGRFCGNPYITALRFEEGKRFLFNEAAFSKYSLPNLSTVYISNNSPVLDFKGYFTCNVITE